MSNTPNKTSIELTKPLATILRLHGEPFESLLEGSEFACGEPPLNAALDLYIPPHVETLVQRVLDLQSLLDSNSEYVDRKKQIKEGDAEYKEIIKEGMLLNDEDFKAFDRHHAVAILSLLSKQLKALPSYSEITSSDDPENELAVFSSSMQKQLFICRFLRTFDSATEGRGEVGRIMAENFFHDALGHFCLLRDAVEFFHHSPEQLSDPEHSKSLKATLGTTRSFASHVLDGNLSIARGQYEVESFNALERMMPAMMVNVNRFRLSFVVNNEIMHKGGEALIQINCDPETLCYGDEAALSLVMYNLIKNPIKSSGFFI